MTSIGVSILNFHAADTTIACVRSLLAAEVDDEGEYQLQIYVTDNGSSDRELQRIQEGLSGLRNVHQFSNDVNLGFATGHNLNLAKIFNISAPDFVWFLNNDCLVEKQSIHELLACASNHPEVGIWGGTLLEPDGETIQCAGGCFYSSWLSSYRQFGKGKTLTDLDQLDSANYDYIAGASMFMPASTLVSGLHPPRGLSESQEYPWLNEEFFLFFEELDLAARLKPGLQMAWCKKALITHVGGAGTDSHPGNHSPGGEYHSTLSALKFTRLFHPKRLWFMAPARLAAKGLIYLVMLRLDLLMALMRAYADFFRWINYRR